MSKALTGRARLAGVMGWPVAHSRSPRLHGYWLDCHGVDGAYVPLPVMPENLERALKALPLLGFRGVNLTVPHKEAAISVVDSIDETSRAIGAINTIVVEPNGRLRGFNTDVEGFRASVLQSVPDVHLSEPAVVLGAGGAARAVVAALARLGASKIRIVNRSDERSRALIQALAPLGVVMVPVPWSARAEALEGISLLVNTTVLGMAGQEALELSLERLPLSAIVADIVYVPLETPLLAAAKARGHRTVDGLGMLMHQARPGFAAWFGVEPEITPDLREFLIASFGET